MKTVNLVRQLDDTGCGIACAAMIANKSYASVKQDLMKKNGWTDRKTQFYTRKPDLEQLLKKYKIKYKIKKSSSWKDINGCAIVGVNRKPGGYHHWVVIIKDADKFIIVDPHDEDGGVFHGDVWGNAEDGYWHSKGPTDYISLDMKVNYIKI